MTEINHHDNALGSLMHELDETGLLNSEEAYASTRTW